MCNSMERLKSAERIFRGHTEDQVYAMTVSMRFGRCERVLKFVALIDPVILELPCLYTACKHDIQLFVRPTLSLRHPKPRPHQ